MLINRPLDAETIRLAPDDRAGCGSRENITHRAAKQSTRGQGFLSHPRIKTSWYAERAKSPSMCVHRLSWPLNHAKRSAICIATGLEPNTKDKNRLDLTVKPLPLMFRSGLAAQDPLTAA